MYVHTHVHIRSHFEKSSRIALGRVCDKSVSLGMTPYTRHTPHWTDLSKSPSNFSRLLMITTTAKMKKKKTKQSTCVIQMSKFYINLPSKNCRHEKFENIFLLAMNYEVSTVNHNLLIVEEFCI
jgi:hypothetical protein